MENNLENALKHIADSGIGGEIRHESKGHYTFNFDPEKIAASFVAYANSVRPEVVVPSEKEEGEWHQSYNDGKKAGWNECLSEIKSLNPTLTFTELNHTEK